MGKINNTYATNSNEYLKGGVPNDIFQLIQEIKIKRDNLIKYFNNNSYFQSYESNRKLFLENFRKDLYDLWLSKNILIELNDCDWSINIEFINTDIFDKRMVVNQDLYIYIWWILPYYHIWTWSYIWKHFETEINKKNIEIIEKYIEEKWYKKIDPKLFHYPLDIFWGRFLTPEKFKNEVKEEFEKDIVAHENWEDIAAYYNDEQLKKLRSDKKYYQEEFESYYIQVLNTWIEKLNWDYEVYYTPLHLLFTWYPD